MKPLDPRETGLVAAGAALAADQGCKLAMLYGAGFAHLEPGRTIPVLPFFNLVMVWNPGISYGLFPAASRLGAVLLVAICLGAVALLSWLLWRTLSRGLALGYGLVIGGALGNLIDRLLYGKVADFFHFYGFGYDWYVFNLADLAVTLGAVAFIYDVLKPLERSNDA